MRALEPLRTQLSQRPDVARARRFFDSTALQLTDPTHCRAFTLRVTLLRDDSTHVFGETWATYHDISSGQSWTARQRHSIDAALQLPVDAALTQTVADERTCEGEATEDATSLAWQLLLRVPHRDTASEPLPSLRSKLLGVTVVPPSVTVEPSGFVSLRGEGEAQSVRIRVDGWHATTTRLYGRQEPENFASIACDHFDAAPLGTAFYALCMEGRRATIMMPPEHAARLTWDGHTHEFRYTRKRHEPHMLFGPQRWVFSLAGEAGRLRGELLAPRAQVPFTVHQMHAAFSHWFTHPLATLSLVFEPRGGGQHVLRGRASFLEIQPDANYHTMIEM